MAIQCKITIAQGITLESAYINIANPQIIKSKSEDINSYTLGANACVYACKECYDSGKIPLEGFSVTCDITLDGNVLVQAYTALKLNERLKNIEEC